MMEESKKEQKKGMMDRTNEQQSFRESLHRCYNFTKKTDYVVVLLRLSFVTLGDKTDYIYMSVV